MGKGRLRFIPDSVIYLISDILIKAIAFLTLPLFLRMMSTSDYGEFNLYQSYASFFGVFFALNISKGIVRYYVDRENKTKYLGTVVWVDLFLGLFFSALFILEETFLNIAGLGQTAVLLICVGTVCGSFSNLILEDMRARMQALKYGICGLFISIVSTGVGLYLVATADSNKGLLRYVSTCIPLVIIALFTTIYIFKRDTMKFDKDTCKYLLSFSIPLIPYTLSTTIIAEVNKLVFSSVGFSEVGIYSFSVNLSSIIYVAVISINRAYQPVLFKALHDGSDSKKKLKQNLVLYFLAYYGFLVFLNLAIKIFGNEEYSATAYVAPIITAGYGYFFLYSLTVNYYYYYKKNWIISAIAICSAAVIGISSYLLIPLLGYIGAALSTFIAYFLMYLFGALFLKYRMKINAFTLKQHILLQLAIVVPAVIKVFIEI